MNAKLLHLPQHGTYLSDNSAMSLALEAASQGVRGANPLVGAVICDAEGRFLTAGWHRGAGTAHAEADALANAHDRGIDVTGAHMFVTLEPCNHTGRTGPCSHAIADAGIASVTFSEADRTSQASGGAQYLSSHGVKVESGLLSTAAQNLNRRWFATTSSARPWVSAKIASTLDGYIAAADGSSQWITGVEARADGHSIRARVDAIVVGTQTYFDDQPRLTARDAQGNNLPHQPLRIVMGERKLEENATEGQPENFLHIATRDPRIVLAELHRRGVTHLLIEGGPTIISAFIDADAVDEIFWYQAPKILGTGKKAITDLGIETLAQVRRWELDDLGMTPALTRLGDDLRVHLAPVTN